MRWIALLFAFGLPVAASYANGLAMQRQQFAAAERALQQNDLATFDRLLPQLRDYALYPYLRHAHLQRLLPTLSAAQVAAALEEFRGTLYEDLLLQGWLHVLAQRRQWQDFLALYRPIGQDLVTECHHVEALAASGHAEVAWRKFETLWLRGQFLPEACEAAERAWKNAGQQTEERLWQRFERALEARHTALVRHLAAQLPATRQVYAQRWQAVYDDPRQVLHPSWFPGQDAVEQAILSHGLRRLARRDIEAATAAWAVLQQRPFSAAQRAHITQQLALQRAMQHRADALAALDALPDSSLNRELRAWGLRAALLAQDWAAVLRWYERLEPDQAQEERWRYWRARADEALGRTTAAQAQYQALAAHHSYYAFLAADRLGIPYAIADVPLAVDEEALARFAHTSGMHRVLEWYALGRLPQARREWQYILEQQDEVGRLHMAQLLQRAGWHSQAILTVARVEHSAALELRFPVLFREDIERHAASQALDPALVLAVVRQESAFDAAAQSPAGAIGLMQIMPATGRLIARALKTAAPDVRALADPDLNLRLGTWYLSDLLRRFGGHLPLALAGYNAGPHRVQKWRPQRQPMEASVWVELIPFSETRGYVQRILSYGVFYEHRLGRPITPLPQRMPPVPPRGKTSDAADAAAEAEAASHFSG